jgi:hypothetical protein
MKKFKFSFLLIIAALAIAAVGSAALSSISFGRSVTGQVFVDTDENVAIQISNISNYVGLVKTDTDGKVSFNLNAAVGNRANGGYNTDANFSIGTASSGVIKIKNNSDIPVTVTMNSTSNNTSNNSAISLVPTSGSSATIGVGSSSNYYFTINTNGQDALKELNAVVHIEGK